MKKLISELNELGKILQTVTPNETGAVELAKAINKFTVEVMANADSPASGVEAINKISNLLETNPGVVAFLTDEKMIKKVSSIASNPMIKSLLK